MLRIPQEEDTEELLGLVRASGKLLKGWVTAPGDRKAFLNYVRWTELEANRGYFVCRVEDERIVGVFNLSQIVYGLLQSAYLGFYVGQEYERHGYMTEGLRLVLKEAFGPLKLHRVEANIQPENERSLKLVERCGFRREGYSPRYLKIGGRWRDHERWAILKEGRQD